jgi:hypothetical protein
MSFEPFIRDFIGRNLLSRNEFLHILVLYNPDRDIEYFKTMLFDALEARKLEPIPQQYDYRIPPKERNFKFPTASLIKYAEQMKWNVPEELSHTSTRSTQESDNNLEPDTNLNKSEKRNHAEENAFISKENIRTSEDEEILIKFQSSPIYDAFKWVYQKFYKDRKSFDQADAILRDITKEFNQSKNREQGELYLSQNECKLVNNLTRIIWGLK